jgi:hypothetical protein
MSFSVLGSQSGTHRPPLPFEEAKLVEANINPVTGLANDYLNHFNEAIMVLELLDTMPDCVDYLFAWRPMSYREHFATSKLKHRDLALAAYEKADPSARRRLNQLAADMNASLTMIRDRLRAGPTEPGTTSLARDTAAQLKSQVVKAAAVINGAALSEASTGTSSSGSVAPRQR